jgi:uncharacterized phiE125 gp8 family phage protein
MSLQLNTPPATEPVTLAQAKVWLKVETDDEDALITALIPAARARCEWHTGRAFVTQGWTLWLDRVGECVELPLPPLAGVETVTLYGADDAAHLLASDQYRVDVSGARVLLKAPHPGLRPRNAAAITFTAGYGDAADVPAPIASAILLLVTQLYEHRGDTAAPMPDQALALLAPYRVMKL